ncbi:protein FAM83A [Nematolebias whitei]|uniref:protein FAM83A n=1 Tax=Nematolebias whitei TaxID=451745 RepID=UPI0018986AE4|nr:protein FAM83A [Nematolebias whitei]
MDGGDRVLWYRRFRPVGKVRRRVQDLRIPSSSHYLTSGPSLDLSHNESSRLAVDRLLSQGLEGYHEALKAEGEVDFLSQMEKNYILEHGRDGNTGEPDDPSADCQSSCSAGPTDGTDSTLEQRDTKAPPDVKLMDPLPDNPSVQVFFQSESGSAGIKDLIRQFLTKAKLNLAIVMDSFSDPELLCDLLEASRKRHVSVHLLLDHLNLKLFVNMWHDLKLNSKDFSELSVRSVQGRTYCAKTGRKLTGQIAESFIIADWTEVLAGSYSFTWLSGQVHQGLVVLLRDSSASHFHQEFNRLHSSSEPVPGFATLIPEPPSLCPRSSSQEAQNGNTVRNGKSKQTRTTCLWTWNEEAQSTPTETLVKGLHDPRSLDVERSKGGAQPVEGQRDWRSLQTRMTSLGRSKSLTERHRGGPPPNRVQTCITPPDCKGLFTHLKG